MSEVSDLSNEVAAPTNDPTDQSRYSARTVIVDLLRPGKRRVVFLSITALLASLFETASLYLIARIASKLAVEEGSGHRISLGVISDVTIIQASAITLVTTAVSLGFSYISSKSAANFSEHSIRSLRQSVVRGYLRSPWESRSNDAEGRFQQLGTEFTQRSEVVVQQSIQLLVALLAISSLIAAALLVSALPTIVLGLTFGLLGLALKKFFKGTRQNALGILNANRSLSRSLSQTARLAQEVEAFDVTDQVTRRLDEEISTGAAGLGAIRFNARMQPSLYQAIALGTIAVLAALVAQLGTDSAGQFAPLLLLLIRALTYVKQLQTSRQTLVEYVPFAIELRRSLDEFACRPLPSRTWRLRNFSVVRLWNVGYAYAGGKPVLENVNLELTQGEFLGLVGPSGAGKSTLASIIGGLRSPTSGSVHLDDAEIGSIVREDLAKLVALVPQENKLIAGSVLENICFLRTGVTREAAVAAAKAAYLDADILAMPDGYDTLVGPGARDLSGGQKQRLGIARALANDPELLILDEPTSALDSASEQYVQQTLADLVGKITVIVVAHRPATLGVCTRILRVDQRTITDIAPAGAALQLQEHE